MQQTYYMHVSFKLQNQLATCDAELELYYRITFNDTFNFIVVLF